MVNINQVMRGIHVTIIIRDMNNYLEYKISKFQEIQKNKTKVCCK